MRTKKPPSHFKHPWRQVPPEAKLVTLEVYFSEEELIDIETRAAAAEMSVEDYCLACLLDAAGTT